MKFIIKFIKTIFSLFLLVCVLGCFLAAYAFFGEPNMLKSEEVNITSDKISSDVKIAVFADTHFGAGYTLEKFDKVIEDINGKDVDFVLFLGDLIDDFNHYTGDTAQISSKLTQIKAKQGKFAVFGNHDYGGGAQNYYQDIMNDGGFKVLKNQNIYFSNLNLNFTGLDDFLLGSGNVYAANNLSASTYNFILCHEPDIFDKLNKNTTDLMTAGHSHGGQVNIPVLRDEILPSLGSKYVKGQYTDGASTLYVNPGLGTTKVNARLFASPEVTYFNIHK